MCTAVVAIFYAQSYGSPVVLIFAKFIEYKLDKLRTDSNFLKEFCIATIFCKISRISAPNLDIEERSGCHVFKNPYCNPFPSEPCIISHPHFLMGCYHFSSDVFQNKTIIVGFFTI